jgi:protein gp37
MSRMFKSIDKTWNLTVGCVHDCLYCWARRQAKRQKHRCKNCYKFVPHVHLNRPVPHGRRIFVCSMGDAWCSGFSDKIISQILKLLELYPERTFLNCTKNPSRYQGFIDIIPKNCLLGTSIETNRDNIIRNLSKAPLPSKRFEAMAMLDYPHKFLSVEPIMDFDLPILLGWIKDIKPELCEIGYNNYPTFKLTEPPLSKTQELITAIRSLGCTVLEKTIRKAWSETKTSET